MPPVWTQGTINNKPEHISLYEALSAGAVDSLYFAPSEPISFDRQRSVENFHIPKPPRVSKNKKLQKRRRADSEDESSASDPEELKPPLEWSGIDKNIRALVVAKLDHTSRFHLALCSYENLQIVNSVRMGVVAFRISDRRYYEDYRTGHNFVTGTRKMIKLYIDMADGKKFRVMFATGNKGDCKMVWETPSNKVRTMILKNRNFQDEALNIANRYLEQSDRPLECCEIEMEDKWPANLFDFPSVKQCKKFQLISAQEALICDALEKIEATDLELELTAASRFSSNLFEIPQVRMAKSVTVLSPSEISDNQFRSLQAKFIAIRSTFGLSLFPVHERLSKWLSGEMELEFMHLHVGNQLPLDGIYGNMPREPPRTFFNIRGNKAILSTNGPKYVFTEWDDDTPMEMQNKIYRVMTKLQK